jgi:DNA (cytosine-5)-methyltransferase 1
MSAYYNENDPKLCAWLRELIKRGLIADGVVDERSIADVRPADLAGFAQCHFFAGIAGWSHALRLAEWPDDRPVWTGSCPCQPFSSAGKQEGAADPRHLWPEWFRLIRECRPVVVFGEQVAAAIGHGWLDLVSSDLEGEGYAVGAVVLGAHSVGAPHIRQRLYFVAESECGAAERHGQPMDGAASRVQGEAHERQRLRDDARNGESAGVVAHPASERQCGRREDGGGQPASVPGSGCEVAVELVNPTGEQARGTGLPRQDFWRACGVANPHERDASAEGIQRSGEQRQQQTDGSDGCFWSPCDWLPCLDGKARPVEPGTFPLAHGVPGRVVKLRGYGNAIVPQVAAEVIRAYMESGSIVVTGG